MYFVIVFVLSFFSSTSLYAKGELKNIRIQKLKERRYEVAFVLRGNVQTQDLDKMHACMGRVDHRLSKQDSLQKVFRVVQWQKKELKYLNNCGPRSCKYRFPLDVKKRLAGVRSIKGKKIAYFQALRRLTFQSNKKKKKNAVALSQVSHEPCAKHPAFRRLLLGNLTPSSRIFWRKMSKEERIRPTIQTFHVATWKVGNIRCIGRVLLFADNYYYDHLELVQLIPSLDKSVRMQIYVRSNFDFLDKWWSFMLKWKLRKAVRKQAITYVTEWSRSCS